MRWYCEKCKSLHNDTELCPRMREQLRQTPELLSEAADFTALVGQYHLITSNFLDHIAQGVNSLLGTDLVYEGTKQFARDIQVFRRLNTEAYSKAGIFSSPEKAKYYLEHATKGQHKGLVAKINGSSQEVDWLIEMQGRIRSLIEKSDLLNGNAPGVDGVTINRLTGKTISRTSVKAAQSKGGINTNVQQIIEAIKLDRLDPNEVVYGVKGTKERLFEKLEKEIRYAKEIKDSALVEKLNQAKSSIRVSEHNTPEQVLENNERIMRKISENEAVTQATANQIADKALQGAVVAAAINLSISAITNYMRFKNGEIDLEEAISEASEDTLKGAISGASLSVATIFLPAGPVGAVAGMAIGIYIDATATNILDEIYGKGAYGAILNSSGYVYGMTVNLQEAVEAIRKNLNVTNENIAKSKSTLIEIHQYADDFERMKGE